MESGGPRFAELPWFEVEAGSGGTRLVCVGGGACEVTITGGGTLELGFEPGTISVAVTTGPDVIVCVSVVNMVVMASTSLWYEYLVSSCQVVIGSFAQALDTD